MAALSQARTTPKRAGNQGALPVTAATTIWQGALVAMKSGYAKPGAADATQVVVGVAEKTANNSAGAAGDINVPVDRGTFRFDIYSSDAVAIGDVGATVYVYDDHTIAKTDAAASRPAAGKLIDVDSVGAWVRVGL